MSETIEDLVRKVQSGNRNVIEQLLDQFQPLIYRYARQNRNLFGELADARQEAVYAILMAIKDYNPQKGVGFAGFVKSRVCCHFITLRRQKQKDTLGTAVSLDAPLAAGENGTLLELLADPQGTNGEEKAVESEIRHALLACLPSLPKKQRRVIILRYGAELGTRQIAKLWGVVPSAVCQLEKRALKTLRQKLQSFAPPA